jgi:hypothetical protein
MNLVERTERGLVFSLGAHEKGFLERLLGFYPLMPATGHGLTRDSRDDTLAEATRFLQESLRDARAEHSRWLRECFVAGDALTPEGESWRLILDADGAERLLRILNDLRVGAWMRLGCPEAAFEEELTNSPKWAPFYAIMMLAGQFEMELIHGLHDEFGRSPAGGA